MEEKPHTYSPEILSRRGEFIAWASAGLIIVGWAILQAGGRAVPRGVGFLVVFLVLAGASMSLGNWMDRHTALRLDEKGVHFKNGLRNVHFAWEDIERIVIQPSNWGARVQVIGAKAHFNFRKLGVVEVGGDEKGRMGFPEGDQIVATMIAAAGLHEVSGSEPRAKNGPTVYARR